VPGTAILRPQSREDGAEPVEFRAGAELEVRAHHPTTARLILFPACPGR
jgi:hypothetical protein